MRIETLINIQHEETGRLQEWPVDLHIPYGWARTSEPFESELPNRWIVTEYRKDLRKQFYVAARPGYMRCKDGTFARDGSFAGGPEWTADRNKALEFTSKLAAARVKGKCPSATLQKV